MKWDFQVQFSESLKTFLTSLTKPAPSIFSEDSDTVRKLKEDLHQKFLIMNDLTREQEEVIHEQTVKLSKQNYLLFIMHKDGYPVERYFEKHIKDVSS